MSQNLISLAKDNGSTDNISIIVVFLRPLEELVDIANTKEKEGSTETGTGRDHQEFDLHYDLWEVIVEYRI